MRNKDRKNAGRKKTGANGGSAKESDGKRIWDVCLNVCLPGIVFLGCVVLAYSAGKSVVMKSAQRMEKAAKEASPAPSASPSGVKLKECGDNLGFDSWGGVDYQRRGGWVSEGNGTYHFYANKVYIPIHGRKGTNSSETIVRSRTIEENWAKINYNAQTRTLRIFGTGVMFYDDSTTPLNQCKYGSTDRWEQVPFPFDRKEVKKIVVESGVTEVSRYAFGGFTNVEEIILPDTIKTIKAFAFYDCKSLRKLTIPDHVKTLERECFGNSGDEKVTMEELTLGKSVREIGNGNFLGVRIQEIKVAKGNSCFEVQDGVLYGIQDRKAYVGCTGKKQMSIRAGTTAIGEFAFCRNDTLQTISIADSVEKIGGGAFYDCGGLKSIRFGNASKCKKFAKYKVPGEGTVSSYCAIANCVKLEGIRIPDPVKKLNGSFVGCKALREIYIGKSLHETKAQISLSFSDAARRYYEVSPDNLWYSCKAGKLYTKAKRIDGALQ